MRIKLISAVLALAAVLVGGSIYLSRSGGGSGTDETYAEAPASVELSDRAIVTGLRSGKGVAIADLKEVAGTLAFLSEADIDRLVRAALKDKAEEWFAGGKLSAVPEMTVEVVTISKHDEYQRPDPKSAVRHGVVVIANEAGSPGEVVGELNFAGLRDLRDQFEPVSEAGSDTASEPTTIIKDIPLISPEQMAEADEQILFDELDLWHHPRSLSNTYPSFEPVRVRTVNSQYFFRNDILVDPFAASGHRYGELNLTGTSGSVMYLPQSIDFSGTIGYTLRLRKSNPDAKIRLRLYVNHTTFATISEGEKEFQAIADTEWHEVRIPFSSFEFVSTPVEEQQQPDWTNPEDFLNAYDGVPGDVYAIELGMENAAAGDQLFFDRLSVLRSPSGRKPGVLTGRVTPPAGGDITVNVKSKDGQWKTTPESDGRFEIELPTDVGIFEVTASSGLQLYPPKTGIYLEMSDALPELEISTLPEEGTDYPVSEGFNASTYVYDAPIGARFKPGHFGFAKTNNGEIQLFLEQRINSFGFLDRDRRLENPDKAFRVVVIGDSYYEGIFNDMRDAVWNQAEARSAMMMGRPVEGIAASHHHAPFINSWSQFTEYALKLEPDLVIISLIHPEILNFAIEDYVRDWLGFDPAHPPSAIFSLNSEGKLEMKEFDPEWQVHKKPLSEEEKARVRSEVQTIQYVREDIENAPAWVQHNLDTVTAAFAKFGAEARSHGAELAIGYSAFEPNMNRIEDNPEFRKDTSLLRPRMKALAEKAGVTFLDLSKVIYEGHTAEDNLYIPADGHWSSYAHYRAGVALYDAISQRVGD